MLIHIWLGNMYCHVSNWILFSLFIGPDTQTKVFLACHAQQVLAGVHMLARYGPMQMHQILEQESVEKA